MTCLSLLALVKRDLNLDRSLSGYVEAKSINKNVIFIFPSKLDFLIN